MRGRDKMWTVVTLVVWYLFAYYVLWAIKNPVSIGRAAFVLLVLGLAGTVTCPWFLHTCAWKELMHKDGKKGPEETPKE